MFTDLPRYEAYENSQAVWLPPRPAHWRERRVKSVLSERSVKGFPDEPLLAATQSRGVIRKTDYETRTVTAEKSLETLKLVDIDDFVISLRSFQGGIERAHARGIISPAYTILRANDRADQDWLTHFFKSSTFVSAMSLMVTGIREGQNIDYPRLAREYIPIPPAEEQAAIVKYLGHAHARIDRAIAAKRKLIALLEEQRRALVNRIVVEGVGEGSRGERQNISWLGDIPAHWEVRRAKCLFQEFDTRSGTGGEPLLSLRVHQGLVRHDEVSGAPPQAASLAHYKVVSAGDLVMNRMRAASGVFAVATDVGLVSPDYSTMRPAAGVVPEYYLELFRTRLAMAEFRRRSSGLGTGESGFMRLQYANFGRITMPLPPEREQSGIVDRIHEQSRSIREASGRATREIELLREFRTRLTADVVTGQVDVRAIAATLPDLPVERSFDVGVDDQDESYDEELLDVASEDE